MTPSGAGMQRVAAVTVRLTGALLALAVAAVHVADQGGVTALTSPDWLGWSFRLIEVGAVLTALLLLLPPSAWPRGVWLGRSGPGWAAGVLLGAGPFVGYVITRTVGLPGDHADVGNWGDWVGTVSLFVEAALVMLSVSILLASIGARRSQHQRETGQALRLAPASNPDAAEPAQVRRPPSAA